jgi:hypothetical protein
MDLDALQIAIAAAADQHIIKGCKYVQGSYR